jgi:hypothetical protein
MNIREWLNVRRIMQNVEFCKYFCFFGIKLKRNNKKYRKKIKKVKKTCVIKKVCLPLQKIKDIFLFLIKEINKSNDEIITTTLNINF